MANLSSRDPPQVVLSILLTRTIGENIHGEHIGKELRRECGDCAAGVTASFWEDCSHRGSVRFCITKALLHGWHNAFTMPIWQTRVRNEDNRTFRGDQLKLHGFKTLGDIPGIDIWQF